MVVLKPLARALADGDRIYALIRGTAVNQDGRTPGLTVPSQAAQEALVRQACANAGVSPAHVQYVERTAPVPRSAIRSRRARWGMSFPRAVWWAALPGGFGKDQHRPPRSRGRHRGLIKAALAVHHRRIPGNLHFEQPNPDIDFEQLRLKVPVACQRWPAGDGPALAGVNSFGYGGTNAHVVLQEAPEGKPKSEIRNPKEIRNPNPERALLVPLSARSPEALRAAADAMQQFVTASPAEVSLRDIAASAALRRSHHDHRLAVVAHSKEELAEKLAAFVAGQPVPGAVSGRAPADQRLMLGLRLLAARAPSGGRWGGSSWTRSRSSAT